MSKNTPLYPQGADAAEENLIKDGTFADFKYAALDYVDHNHVLNILNQNGSAGLQTNWSDNWNVSSGSNCDLLGQYWFSTESPGNKIYTLGYPPSFKNAKNKNDPGISEVLSRGDSRALHYAINPNGEGRNSIAEFYQTVKVARNADLNLRFVGARNNANEVATLSSVSYQVMLRSRNGGNSYNINIEQGNYWYKQTHIFKDVKKGEYDLVFCSDSTGNQWGAFIADISLTYADSNWSTRVNNLKLSGPVPDKLMLTSANGGDTAKNTEAWTFSLFENNKPFQGEVKIRLTLESHQSIYFTQGRMPSLDITLSGPTFTLGVDAIEALVNGIQGSASGNVYADIVDGSGTLYRIAHVGYGEMNNFVPYSSNPAIPLTIKGHTTADTWTIEGDIPATITKTTSVTLTLKKNGTPASAGESLTAKLNTSQYLDVDPEQITTGAGGQFTLTLTPKPNQQGSHSTTLTISHAGAVLRTWTITTEAAPASKYEIKVYSAEGKLLLPDSTLQWPATGEKALTVAVVDKVTNIFVDKAEIAVTSSEPSTLAVDPTTEKVTFTRAAGNVTVYLEPKRTGNATLTFTSDGAEPVRLNVHLGSGAVKNLVADPHDIWLSAGLTETGKGDKAPLTINFNPPVAPGTGTPPNIDYKINNTDHLYIINEQNQATLHGTLTPKEDTGYQVMPQFSTDDAASEDCSITFSTRDDEYAPVTVNVHFSTVARVQWSVTNPVAVACGEQTNLKLKMKVLDNNSHPLSTFALEVVIESKDTAGATFADSGLTSLRVTSARADGWVYLPELDVKNPQGTFTLFARVQGKGTSLPEGLTFNAKPAQDATSLVLHPKDDQQIDFNDIDEGFGGNNYYAELLAGVNPVHTGSIRFTLSTGAGNTANAKFAGEGNPTQRDISVNSSTGKARWPLITADNPGVVTLTASSGNLPSQSLLITIQ